MLSLPVRGISYSAVMVGISLSLWVPQSVRGQATPTPPPTSSQTPTATSTSTPTPTLPPAPTSTSTPSIPTGPVLFASAIAAWRAAQGGHVIIDAQTVLTGGIRARFEEREVGAMTWRDPVSAQLDGTLTARMHGRSATHSATEIFARGILAERQGQRGWSCKRSLSPTLYVTSRFWPLARRFDNVVSQPTVIDAEVIDDVPVWHGRERGVMDLNFAHPDRPPRATVTIDLYASQADGHPVVVVAHWTTRHKGTTTRHTYSLSFSNLGVTTEITLPAACAP